MHAPDVRWDGVSHDLIVKWTSLGRGAVVTEQLESRLKSVTTALNAAANLVNETLRRVNGGEWTGTAASTAAQAMQVLRDFNDTMKQHGEVNSVAAYGQSDNASWVRASVPAVVETRAAQEPTGGLIDIINSTVDYQRQQQAAKDAEEHARQVMRQYESMTTDRISALPPLSPVPRVAFDVEEDTLPSNPKPVSPSDGDDTAGDTPNRQQGGPAGNGPRVPADGNGSPGTNPGSSAPSTTDPARASGAQQPPHSGAGHAGESARTGSGFGPVAGGLGAVGGGADAGRGPLRAGRPFVAGPRAVEPGGRGPRGGVTEVFGRGAKQASGVTPIGHAGPGRSDEDKDHQVKYGVPGSEIFEPDNDDGLLHDPFRPGSFVAPATIGDDNDE